jgi:hypothetical protein
MSLHKFADMVASKGRGEDSLLIHMTPDEVQRLQQFAQANGRSLTINPDTGLPEAGMLSDLFKSIAPIALGAFLGPAGFGLSSMMAGVATGGITALATGSLSRGLMAGLGAYGGAGLAQGFMDAGTTALGGAGAETALQAPSVDSFVGNAEGMTSGDAFNNFLKSDANPAVAGKADVFGAGAKAAMADPLGFAKNNLTNIGMAAAPIMAGAMVPTTTKLPEPRDAGLIRQMAFNINPDTGRPDPLYGTREMTPVKASEFGNKTFQGQRELFRQQNPNPYELGVGSLNQPPQQQPAPMASGGIVALATGGPPTVMADKDLFTQTGDWNKAAALRDEQINAVNTYNWQQQADARDQAARASNITADADRLRAATNTNTAVPVDYNALATNFVNTAAANPNITTADFISGANAANIGLTQPLATALDKSGLSLGSQYALTHANIGDAGNVEETYGGLKGLSSNINYSLAAYNADAANKSKTGLQKQADALAALGKYGLNEADVKRATGRTLAELFPSTLTKPIEVVPGGTQLPGATVYDNGAYGNYGSGPATGVDYKGNTVSIATPGDIITNTDGTRTVVPNIPGRPYGGFTGVEQLRSRYTAGGGNLGYTAPIPKDPEASFNKMTDDSLDAYKFLMGKGKNLTQRKAETRDRPVMARYDEAVLGRKIPKLTKATTTTKTDTKETVAGDTAVVGGVSFDLTNPAQAPAEDNNGPWSWDVASKKWVQYGKFADGGITGYAVGGGIGSLGSYSDGGRLLKGPGDGVSDSIPATIGSKNQPARLADGEFVIPARIVSELGNGSTEAGAKKLYAMMDRVQRARGKTTGKNKVAANSRSDKYLPA